MTKHRNWGPSAEHVVCEGNVTFFKVETNFENMQKILKYACLKMHILFKLLTIHTSDGLFIVLIMDIENSPSLSNLYPKQNVILVKFVATFE